MSNLTTLILDHNRIRKLKNLRGLRKLEKLSLTGNFIKDISLEGTEPLIELKELNL